MIFNDPPGSYDICPICFWEDDQVQLFYPDQGGANINLIDAQQNFEQYGAVEEKFTSHVRKPSESEKRDPLWRKFDLSKDNLKDLSNYWEGVKETVNQEPEYYWLK